MGLLLFLSLLPGKTFIQFVIPYFAQAAKAFTFLQQLKKVNTNCTAICAAADMKKLKIIALR
jgi:hypothetical protein